MYIDISQNHNIIRCYNNANSDSNNLGTWHKSTVNSRYYIKIYDDTTLNIDELTCLVKLIEQLNSNYYVWQVYKSDKE